AVSEGSYITPASRIANIQQIEPVKIDFSVPEKYMDRLPQKGEIYFTVQGSKDTFTGSIYATEPKVDAATRSVQLRALSSNKAHKLLPGAFAEIDLPLKEIPSAL